MNRKYKENSGVNFKDGHNILTCYLMIYREYIDKLLISEQKNV